MERRDLVEVIQSDTEVWPGKLTKLLRYKDDLTVVQGVAMYKDHLIIHSSLRAEFLETLHSGHQHDGQSLQLRLVAGQDHRHQDEEDKLPTVQQQHPSQAKEPPEPLPDLQYPGPGPAGKACSKLRDLRGTGSTDIE